MRGRALRPFSILRGTFVVFSGAAFGARAAPALSNAMAPIRQGVSPAAAAKSLARTPVLAQIKLPHPYYFREMYLPQLSSGPSAVAWSPDGQELVYSMQGSLWRQEPGSAVARQLTDGPGYAYQPDWSPDGRGVVYARYDADAVEICYLDLASGKSTPLTRNGGVNVEPRWSPDGRRVAFVSTSHAGRFHVFTSEVELKDGVPTAKAPLRVTEDVDSALPRYYYDSHDHYLSPSWSPDGNELIVVSNRGRVWGTGGFWRLRAQAGSELKPLHFEETTWKARPDWSRDGKRVVFSSYHGRQWNQLWLTTALGGDPIQLTYGDFDATAPRWSPDGKRIAYVSNEGGETSLWTLELPGAKRQKVKVTERKLLASRGTLVILLEDGEGRPLPGRISVRLADGRGAGPADAWLHSEDTFTDPASKLPRTYFHSSGRSELSLPSGKVEVAASHGLEHRIARSAVAVKAGAKHTLRLRMPRIADSRRKGWVNGDLHVHMNYGGSYRASPESLARQARAEDLQVIENLIVNKEQRVPDVAWFSGAPDKASNRDLLLFHSQEFHTNVWSHIGLLGLRQNLLLPGYAGYANTAAQSFFPGNADVADLARAQGALVGYVHPFDTLPDPHDPKDPVASALPVDAALGKVDYMELVGFSDHRATTEVWQRLLNCGLRISAGAGTDAMTNYAQPRGPLGMNRVYVNTGGKFEYAAWLEGIRTGRSFATNAPILEFSLGGKGIGSEIKLAAAGDLAFRVKMNSSIPVDRVEIVGNGEVVKELKLSEDGSEASASGILAVKHSGWYALRASATAPHADLADAYAFAITSPVYVLVGAKPIASASDARYFVAWIDRLVATASEAARKDFLLDKKEQAALLDSFGRARAFYARQAPDDTGKAP